MAAAAESLLAFPTSSSAVATSMLAAAEDLGWVDPEVSLQTRSDRKIAD